MIKCDLRAKAKCLYKKLCCGDGEGYFVEGSKCDKFNQRILEPPPTTADHIRAMSDKELAAYFAMTFCHGYGQPQLLNWLRQPWEEDPS